MSIKPKRNGIAAARKLRCGDGPEKMRKKGPEKMSIAEMVSLIRESDTMADVLHRLEKRSHEVEPSRLPSNVVYFAEERRKRRLSSWHRF